MSTNSHRSFATFATLLALGLGAVAAEAQTITVRCDVYPNRSRASIDGSELADGQYSAVLISGAHDAQSPMDAAVLGEVSFDFDSNKQEVQQGATQIGRHFIVNDMVTGKLLDASGNVVAKKHRQCRVH